MLSLLVPLLLLGLGDALGTAREVRMVPVLTTAVSTLTPLASTGTSSRRECVQRCVHMPGCVSALSDPTADPAVSCLLYSQLVDYDVSATSPPAGSPAAYTAQFSLAPGEWTVVLRVSIGCGLDPYVIWADNGPYNEGQSSLQSATDTAAGVFKSPLVDSAWHKVSKVRLGMYAAGTEVFYVVFDASGSDKHSWIEQARILESSSSDIADASLGGQATFFTTAGEDTSNKNFRRFYLESHHSGCSGDSGWLTAMSAATDVCDGTWGTTGLPRPVLLYSTTGLVQPNKDMGHGDVLIISVQP